MQKASNRFAEFDLIRALAIVAFSENIRLSIRVSGLIKLLAAYSFPIYLLDFAIIRYVSLVFDKLFDSADMLFKLAFLASVNLMVCMAIIYLLQKLLPKHYSQYILGI
jgi:probable poly-beta-1,6-N-acetyl-D-glucosamine export protein